MERGCSRIIALEDVARLLALKIRELRSTSLPASMGEEESANASASSSWGISIIVCF